MAPIIVMNYGSVISRQNLVDPMLSYYRQNEYVDYAEISPISRQNKAAPADSLTELLLLI